MPDGPDPADLEVRRASAADLERTAALHARRLPAGFFARLGPSFLARYHASFAASPDATLLVVERDGRVEGFLAGTVHNARHYRFVLRQRPVGLATSGVAALARDRDLAAEFVRTRVVRYGRAVGRRLRPGAGGAAGAAAPNEPVVAVLTHLAVSAGAAGSGAGSTLTRAFEAEAAAAGADEIRLVTATRGGGAGFYRRLGWRSRGVRPAADGTVVEEFTQPL